MRKRGEDRMEPFAMDFDENKEMTDDEDFSIDMTPEYMFQKFELVLFLLADRTADLIGPQSQLRLQDKLNISDAFVFRIQQELGQWVGMTRGWFCTRCLLVCCKMLGCSTRVIY